MRYRLILTIIVFLLIINSAFAAGPGEEDISETTPQNQFKDKFPDIPAQQVSAFQDNGDGTFTVNFGQITSDGANYKNGVDVVLDAQGNIIRAGKITLPNGAVVENANIIDATGKDNYKINYAGELREGPIILTNAENVQYNNGILTAGSAANMDYKGSTSNDVIMLIADNKEFSVEKASAVQAGCFLVEDVEHAKFNVGRTMLMTTSGTGKVVYDSGTKINYEAKQLDSTLTGSITACRRPTYQVKAMELNTKTGNLTELVNGSGEIQLDGRYGVVCLNLTPISTYDIDTGRYEDSFGFIIKEYAYKLCIQKAVAQQLVADCPLCGLVDLPNQKIVLNGAIEYARYLYDVALIDANKRTAFKSTGFGKNTIDLTKKEVLIEKDEPEIRTTPSNYLELREIKESAGTHRFLGINEKQSRISSNWFNVYTTTYSDSKTTILDNFLDYTRGNCHVAVLPPNSKQVQNILSSLQAQKVSF